MVYRGKPSPGCANCRKKRIKCNGERPACLQCTRVGKDCPGYRNPLDLMFCDQSNDVRSKFGGEQKPSPPSGIVQPETTSTCPSAMGTLEVGLEDHARGFFFHNYVLEDGYALSSYDYLPELYSQDFGPLHPAILAVGTAGLAVAISSPCILMAARRQYTLALSLTNGALRDPYKACEDATLVSILLLGLFEDLTCDNQQSMETWQQHISGCVALIPLRRPDQVQSKAGFKIFMQWRTQVLIGCLRRKQQVPEVVSQWSAELAK
ncbi:uncharacterized protein PAC_13470 [Phialocephala subalpina]|uniref:Zn(2)-C6 fungal-type domain-containing protein n=1 Tax=Phialocephala subalpina TaxID=576137 RepID=A0A1L7XEX3_9HELO|nr:uncharacterized protein PAC_13470 [Phialocephala subalpina]